MSQEGWGGVCRQIIAGMRKGMGEIRGGATREPATKRSALK